MAANCDWIAASCHSVAGLDLGKARYVHQRPVVEIGERDLSDRLWHTSLLVADFGDDHGLFRMKD